LRRERAISYDEALALVRHPPFVLFDNVYEHKAESVRQELESFGAALIVEKVGEQPNPLFGPVQRDRLRFVPSGPGSDEKPAWQLVAAEIHQQELEHIACAKCLALGMLTEEPEELDGCPACKQKTLVEIGGWIT
jgi:hypothetical protein